MTISLSQMYRLAAFNSLHSTMPRVARAVYEQDCFAGTYIAGRRRSFGEPEETPRKDETCVIIDFTVGHWEIGDPNQHCKKLYQKLMSNGNERGA